MDPTLLGRTMTPSLCASPWWLTLAWAQSCCATQFLPRSSTRSDTPRQGGEEQSSFCQRTELNSKYWGSGLGLLLGELSACQARPAGLLLVVGSCCHPEPHWINPFTPVQRPDERVKGGTARIWTSLPEKQLGPHSAQAISSVVGRTTCCEVWLQGLSCVLSGFWLGWGEVTALGRGALRGAGKEPRADQK